MITDLVKQGFPEIESVFRYDMLATVISTDRDRGVATVHPMRPDGAKDEMTDDIPDVPLPTLPSPAGPAYIVPDNGELVRMVYYYHDPSQPKIVECLGKGHIYGDLLWTTRDDKAKYSLTDDGVHTMATGHTEINGATVNIG